MRFTRHIRIGGIFAMVAIVAALVGCGGGGGSNPPQITASAPGVKPTGSTSGQAMTVAVSIVVPSIGTGAAARSRAYVSPSTMGLILRVGDSSGTNSFGYALTKSSTNCTTLSGENLQCTFSVPAKTGVETFSAWLYDAAEGTSGASPAPAPTTASGKLLSQDVGVSQTIAIDKANLVTLTLAPVVATVSSTAGPQIVSVSATRGKSGSTTATPPPVFNGIDADGNGIGGYSTVASGAYANPIALTVADGGKNDITVAPTSFSNATTNAFVATFDGDTAVQPVNASTVPYDAIVTATDAFSGGGSDGNASYPTSTATVTVAPLFAYAATYALTVGAATGSTTVLYGLAAAVPAGATYSIVATSTSGNNSCGNFTLTKVAGALTGPQTIAYTVAATALSPTGDSCVFAISDGTGTVTNSVPFTATAPIYHPSVNADSFSFSGTEVVTYQRPNQVPSPEPTTTAAYNVTQSVSVTNPATFAGNSVAVDFKTNETDSEITGPSTSPIQNAIDTYYAFDNTITQGHFYTLGFTSLDSNNFAITDTYGSPGSITDILPEAGGASWTNTAAQTLTTSSAEGITSIQTYAADGTYTENINYPSNGANATGTPNPGATALFVQKLDGSAVYDADRNGNARTGDTVYTFATPNAAANTITITTQAPPLVTASPGATPTVTSTTVPNWIPTGYLGTNLYTESDVDSGATTIPTACKVPSSFGTMGNKIAATINRVDTILGEYEVRTLTYYDVANIGPVCTVLHDVLTSYYDYTGQTYPGYWSGVPQQITVVDETLALTAQQLNSAARRPGSRDELSRSFVMHASALPARLAAFHAKRRATIQRNIRARILQHLARRSIQGGH